MEIFTKSENQDHFRRGMWGNKLQSWDSIREWEESGFSGEVVLRSRLIGSGRCVYHVHPSEVLEIVNKWAKQGYDPANVYLNEQGPDDVLRIFQGEIQRSENYYDLTYSYAPFPMREALSSAPKWASGLEVVILLRSNLWPSSYSDLVELFELYPDSVIEFTSYDRSVGDCRHRNTVIWEVRNY